ncbi:MAG: bifunctional homocysteine S-methyltransferase/methylenetetrahydrofolate reductase [Acidobacteriota bacterium]|nr:bifunctional homocysteine S-methyltransferase/methylenetetrahydrofolate reductase [Acidobacteriota bacterium]MDH3784739.1 bifunctional homocysteine S-methyltransferase/methylenetetrahydrofolate reductase [Acidobacteriota bacterium]
MSRDFRRWLADRIVVFDGAMGTVLYSQGVFINRCFDELCVSSPSSVLDVHRSYVNAGVDVIETNTFGATRPKLDQHGFGDRVAEINEAGARLAREAAGEKILVAGAMGPLGVRIEPWGPTSTDEASEFFREQVAALLAGGVDLFSVETFSDLTEIEAAIRAIRGLSDLPIVAQLTIDDDGTSLEGAPPAVFGPRLNGLDVDAIGVNCSVGPAAMLKAVENLIDLVDKPVIAQPNAGKPRVVEDRNFYLCSPEYMATFARRMIRAGARIVGGCCGTTPEHLKAIRRAVRAEEPARRRSTVTVEETESHDDAVEPVPFTQRSRFAKAIAAGTTVVSVEMLPPKGHDLTRNLRGAARLHQTGVDVINIPDGPRASARMSPMAMAVRLENEIGIESLIHYCCRDRNLLGMQSDLLGAHSFGLRNLLVITGDPPKLGDYPDATAVFDVDAIGLTNMVSRLNHGLDVGGNKIGEPTAFCMGVGVDPCYPDLKREIARFEWKVEAGAEYCITQPVFDTEALLSFLEQVKHVRIPVIAGIWPLVSYRNAEFMNNEVPGVNVPAWILERMRGVETREAARYEGTQIAQEMLEQLLPHVQGVQIAAPFGRVETAIDVASVIPKERRTAPPEESD